MIKCKIECYQCNGKGEWEPLDPKDPWHDMHLRKESCDLCEGEGYLIVEGELVIEPKTNHKWQRSSEDCHHEHYVYATNYAGRALAKLCEDCGSLVD